MTDEDREAAAAGLLAQIDKIARQESPTYYGLPWSPKCRDRMIAVVLAGWEPKAAARE